MNEQPKSGSVPELELAIANIQQESDYDFSLDTLEKDSFIKVFTETSVEVQE